jgi:thiol-disulfide isomerase/thioredoxin
MAQRLIFLAMILSTCFGYLEHLTRENR